MREARTLRIVSVVWCASFAFAAHLIYDLSANPGHGLEASLSWARVSAAAGAIWAWFVFPKMGRSVQEDIIWIIVAFPFVGAISGSIVPFIGTMVGVLAAVSLPFLAPWPALPLYILGAVVAFALPRLKQTGKV